MRRYRLLVAAGVPIAGVLLLAAFAAPERESSRTRDAAGAALRLVPIVTSGLESPLHLTVAPGETNRLYVVEQAGRIRVIENGRLLDEPFLDIRSRVLSGGEQGLLSVAFHPQYEENRRLYVNYTDVNGDTRIHEFAATEDGVARGTRREVLAVDQPYSNHNGGHLAFGPDGFLYVGLGDGGSGGDPEDNAQDLGTLLGKMLRIDPRGGGGGRPYGVPSDNPFVGREEARPEVWAFGLRNPWRYSFDAETGDLWIGDVGQDSREEIDVQAARSTGGENYGWDAFEGSLPFEPPFPGDTVGPVYDYGRDRGGTVIGGYVYRGSAIPALRGAYLFGDLFNPQIRMLVPSKRGFRHLDLGVRVDNLVSFGQDQAGELYLLSIEGPVYRLAPA